MIKRILFMKIKNILLCAIICSSVLLTQAACFPANLFSFFKRPQTENETTYEIEAAPDSSAASENENVKAVTIPEYYHFDPADFYEKCDRLIQASEESDIAQVKTLYQDLYSQLIELKDLNSAAYVEYSDDVTDSYIENETEYIEETLIECADRFCIACRSVAQGPVGKGFSSFLGDYSLGAYYYDYEDMDEEMKSLETQETALENKYNLLCSDLSNFTATINGKTYDLDYLISDDSYAFAFTDYETYIEAYYGCLEDLNRQTGEIFIELVDIRDRIAKLEGYDNYIDYADKELYYRDYDAEDLESLKTAAKSICADYVRYGETSASELELSDTELVTILGTLVSDIDEITSCAFDLFSENSLYSIGNEEGRLSAGYTLLFHRAHAPFIYLCTSDTLWDVSAIVHEFGHFAFSANYEAKQSPLIAYNLDLCEIHSNGLQMLITDRLKNVLPDHAYEAAAYNITNGLDNVIDGCIYDDWQREVYSNPGMSLDELNSAFLEISYEYYPDDYEVFGYEWNTVSHNFSSPLYYISYATSSFASFQLWDLSRTDFNKAVQTWETILKGTSSDDGYMTVLENSGLKTFKEEGEAERILENAVSYLKEVQAS